LACIELGDVALDRLLLRCIDIEDRRPVLRADVGLLPVELRRIVGDREVHLQQRRVADLLRVVGDLHRFGMAGHAGADQLVASRFLRAAGVAGHRLDHAFDALEDALHAPEAAAGEHRRLHAAGAAGLVDRSRRDPDRGFAGDAVVQRRGKTRDENDGGEHRHRQGELARAAREGGRTSAHVRLQEGPNIGRAALRLITPP
jgi:hypothetical protein